MSNEHSDATLDAIAYQVGTIDDTRLIAFHLRCLADPTQHSGPAFDSPWYSMTLDTARAFAAELIAHIQRLDKPTGSH